AGPSTLVCRVPTGGCVTVLGDRVPGRCREGPRRVLWMAGPTGGIDPGAPPGRTRASLRCRKRPSQRCRSGGDPPHRSRRRDRSANGWAGDRIVQARALSLEAVIMASGRRPGPCV
ncbi:MAG: hypothetical protein AVDCRST_MAG59-3065, partial [uncultured Thermomicrobiales bacterium]